MTELSARNFGLLIAYVLPGFVALWGVGAVFLPVRVWLLGTGADGPSAAGVVYVFLFSIGAGMTASVVRWALLDTALHRSGIPQPVMDFSRLNEHLPAFDRLVEHHYQYYQFYGNTMVAALAAYPAWRTLGGGGGASSDLGFFVLEVFFAAGARDALRNFYARAAQLLGPVQENRHDERIRTSRSVEVERDQAANPGAGPGQAGDGGGGATGPGGEAASQARVTGQEKVPLDPLAFGRL